jgi:hypothetical protein
MLRLTATRRRIFEEIVDEVMKSGGVSALEPPKTGDDEATYEGTPPLPLYTQTDKLNTIEYEPPLRLQRAASSSAWTLDSPLFGNSSPFVLSRNFSTSSFASDGGPRFGTRNSSPAPPGTLLSPSSGAAISSRSSSQERFRRPLPTPPPTARYS